MPFMTSEKGTKMTLRSMVREHAYPALAAVSTLILVITSFSVVEASKDLKNASKALEKVSQSIEPISTWADTQNDCVERTFRINGKDTRGLASKVWSCNGGGD